jgi:hypothetical protein
MLQNYGRIGTFSDSTRPLVNLTEVNVRIGWCIQRIVMKNTGNVRVM